MKKFIIIALILGACRAYQPPTPTSVEKEESLSNQPEWVKRKPTSNKHYIGVGNASLSDPDYQVNAKLEALDDLASEISVTIESTSLLNQIENQAGFSEQFQAAIKSTTTQSIELHEQVDTWSDDQYYWVQYRLSKSQLQQLRKEKKQAALNISRDHFQNGSKARQRGQIIQSLHFYAQSIESLADYLNERNEVIIEEKSIDLSIEAYSRIFSTLSEITLISDSASYQFSPGESQKRIQINAITKDNIPVSNLSINISDRSSEVTNPRGEIHQVINRRTASKGLTAVANFQFFASYPIIQTLIKGVTRPQLTIRFFIPPITIGISSSERNLDQEVDQEILRSMLKKLFTQKGYRVIDSNAEYQVEIKSNTRKGSELSGLFTSYLDFTIDIKNQLNERIYSRSFSEIKGIHTSYQSAGIKAYQNAGKVYLEELENSINKNFINKD
ncbi:LPP20 family lipoprotein [Ekhidna sp.]